MIRRYQLYGLVLGAGIANAMIRPLFIAVEELGFVAFLYGFDISFVVWGALIWSLFTLANGAQETATSKDLVISLIVAIGVLFPTATTSWLVTGTAAFYWHKAGTSDKVARAALAVIAFISFRDPLASMALKIFATPLLDGDAFLASGVMKLWGASVERSGNLITGPNGHQLLILTGCTSYTNLSIAMLGWFSWTQATVGSIGKRQWMAAVSVAVSMIIINIGRLALMGMGPQNYQFIHDGQGAMIVDFLMITTTLVITILGCRNETSKHRLLGRV